jgi:hypothetical protein
MKHNTLTNIQHEFMENKTTVTASHLFIENVQETLDRHLYVVGILLELSKACDVINQSMLLDKLESYRLRGSANKWVTSHLKNRTQCVEISHTDRNSRARCRFQSSPRVTAHGVPLGSILGPLLFLVYK